MALVTADFALDLQAIDLNQILASEIDSAFNLDVFETFNGRTYEDMIWVMHGNPLDPTYSYFGGTGLTETEDGVIIAGTLTGIVQRVDGTGSSGVLVWSVEDMTLSAVSFYNAVVSPGTADDQALLATLFSGADLFDLSPQADVVAGFAGNDRLFGRGGNDTLDAGSGNDYLDGGIGSDEMRGGSGSDVYIVNLATDRAIEASGAGIDQVRSSVSFTLGANVERLTLTGTGDNTGSGNSIANLLAGNIGGNRLDGAGGGDTLRGLGGGDVLNGQGGNDTLDGGAGNDLLNGGDGADILRFSNALNATTNVDRVTGFVAAADGFELDDAVFAGIGAVGALAASAFRAGNAAADADDRLLYVPATGNLWFDADGSGELEKILFARLTPGTQLGSEDFFVF